MAEEPTTELAERQPAEITLENFYKLTRTQQKALAHELDQDIRSSCALAKKIAMDQYLDGLEKQQKVGKWLGDAHEKVMSDVDFLLHLDPSKEEESVPFMPGVEDDPRYQHTKSQMGTARCHYKIKRDMLALIREYVQTVKEVQMQVPDLPLQPKVAVNVNKSESQHTYSGLMAAKKAQIVAGESEVDGSGVDDAQIETDLADFDAQIGWDGVK